MGVLILTPFWKGAAFSTAMPFQQQLALKGRPADRIPQHSPDSDIIIVPP
jgi:hypothetical protein